MATPVWAGVVNTTAPRYLKGASDQTIRSRLFLALLKKHGGITFNESGKDLNWQVEAIQPPVSGFSDGAQLDFTRHNKYRQLTIDWRGYTATDMMTEMETLMNRGDQQLIDRYAQILPGLTKSITDKFGTQVYLDGYAAGNELLLCGINSFMGVGTNVAADRIAEPSDTYAGKSTALGNLGGTWTSALTTFPNANVAKDWPDGEGSSEFDYLSPKMVNWSSTNWGTGATTFEDNCERAIRQLIIWLTLTGGLEGKPDAIVLAGNLFYAYENKMAARFRTITPYKDMEDMGFSGSLQQEGVGISTEFGIAAQTGFAVNFDQVQLRCLTDQLFYSKGPEWDIKVLSWLFAVGYFGNMTWNCKYHGKLFNYA